MDSKHFNLVTDPWIKVMTRGQDQVQTVSLIKLFENAAQYRQLAGDMKAQDLAIMRFLLAILHTVYSRFDAEDEVYDWLTVNPDNLRVDDVEDVDEYNDDLIDTWLHLWAKGTFTPVLVQYLKRYADRFDLFGNHPFYQVTQAEYDSLVPDKKSVATGTGTVAVKQINRLISESGNTPALFAPKTTGEKNELSFAELTRWLITYQAFTGVTDKTKIVTDEPFSTPAGWVYRLNPVYAQGRNVFETLMQNLVLVQDNEYRPETPVWECDTLQSYIDWRKSLEPADNCAALYTLWSRILHIEWDEQDRPTIFSAGIPMFTNENALLEPMTTWKQDTKDGKSLYKPAMQWKQSMGKAMWRQFGQYINVHGSGNMSEPKLVAWLRELNNENAFKNHSLLTLASVALISDGNATSQAPIAEIVDDMQIDADVLFDDVGSERWPERIEEAIDKTQLLGRDYWGFITRMAKLRNWESKEFASRETAKYYDRLNEPFIDWMRSLTSEGNREVKLKEWYDQLHGIVIDCANQFIQTASPRDYKGIVDEESGRISNVFTVYGQLRGSVAKHLKGDR